MVKGASYLEILNEIDVILFDKTGTLTKGEFVIADIKSNDIKLMKSLLYSVEKNFTHAIATSITNCLKEDVSELEITDLNNIPGYGVKAKYNGKNIIIGNEKLLKENGIVFDNINANSTIIYVSFDGEFLGYLILEDELKNDAVKVINELLKKHKVYVISGDKKESVEKVCDVLNIKDYYSELLPNEKPKAL